MEKSELLKALAVSNGELRDVVGGRQCVKAIRCKKYDTGSVFSYPCESCDKRTKYSKCIEGVVYINMSDCPSLEKFSFPQKFTANQDDIIQVLNS